MRRLIWPALLIVFAASLIAGSWPQSSIVVTPQARVESLSKQIRCPTCAGLSVAESDTPLATSAREDIARRVDQGESDDRIRNFFVSRYGQAALMSPGRSGFVGAAWLLPVVLGVLAAALALWAVTLWSRRGRTSPSDEDRRLVEEALRTS